MNTTNIVSIQIEDVNDMPPKFNQPVYTYRIGEKTNIVTNDYQQLTGDGFQIVVSDDDSVSFCVCFFAFKSPFFYGPKC